MVKTAAILFGIFFIVAGIGGFFPALTPDGKLFGLFMVDTIHNLVHLASGIVAMLCAFAGPGASRKYFQIFGLVYGLVAALGFYYQDNPLLGMMAHNRTDIWLHVAISLVSLFLGFVAKDTATV